MYGDNYALFQGIAPNIQLKTHYFDYIGLYRVKKSLITDKDDLENTIEIAYSKIMKKDIKFIRRIIPLEIDGKDKSGNNVYMPIFIYHF